MYSNQLRKQTKVTNKRILGKKKSQDSKDQVIDLLQAEEEERTLATRPVINMTGKTVPIINTGTKLMKAINKT